MTISPHAPLNEPSSRERNTSVSGTQYQNCETLANHSLTTNQVLDLISVSTTLSITVNTISLTHCTNSNYNISQFKTGERGVDVQVSFASHLINQVVPASITINQLQGQDPIPYVINKRKKKKIYPSKAPTWSKTIVYYFLKIVGLSRGSSF